MRPEYDFVIWATYGLGPSREIFKVAKYQVAEKILIELPAQLQNIALVVVDGPFTAFDPYGSSTRSLFGSAKHTNHWTTTDPEEPVPARYAELLNRAEFTPFADTRFSAMRADCCLAVPAAKDAKYLGSRFTMRVVEDNPQQDRRILYVQDGLPGEIHIFSGKVVSAVKAARLVCEKIANMANDPRTSLSAKDAGERGCTRCSWAKGGAWNSRQARGGKPAKATQTTKRG